MLGLARKYREYSRHTPTPPPRTLNQARMLVHSKHRWASLKDEKKTHPTPPRALFEDPCPVSLSTQFTAKTRVGCRGSFFFLLPRGYSAHAHTQQNVTHQAPRFQPFSGRSFSFSLSLPHTGIFLVFCFKSQAPVWRASKVKAAGFSHPPTDSSHYCVPKGVHAHPTSNPVSTLVIFRAIPELLYSNVSFPKQASLSGIRHDNNNNKHVQGLRALHTQSHYGCAPTSGKLAKHSRCLLL